MELARNEITFGSNRCYLGFKKWGYSFTYWGVEDIAVGGWQAEEWSKITNLIKFVPTDMMHHVSETTNVCSVNFIREIYDSTPPRFSLDPDRVYWGSTVTYMLLQIAAVMGCTPIYLIGVDFHFVRNENVREEGSRWHQQGPDENHFCEDYIPTGKFLHHPRLDLQELAFQSARRAARDHGFQVLNATPGSRLNVFDRVEFESLF